MKGYSKHYRDNDMLDRGNDNQQLLVLSKTKTKKTTHMFLHFPVSAKWAFFSMTWQAALLTCTYNSLSHYADFYVVRNAHRIYSQWFIEWVHLVMHRLLACSQKACWSFWPFGLQCIYTRSRYTLIICTFLIDLLYKWDVVCHLSVSQIVDDKWKMKY